MKAVYASLPDDEQAAFEHEAKPLVEQPEYYAESDAPLVPAHAPSKRMRIAAYALCLIAALCAVANLGVALKHRANLAADGYHLTLDKLPRPDIFVGLPNSPTFSGAMDGAKGMAHTHDHDHDHEHTH